MKIPTKEQKESIDFYLKKGYVWDESLSIQFAAVVIRKGEILNIYGLTGEIDLGRKKEEFRSIMIH